MLPVFCVPRGADTASLMPQKARTKAGKDRAAQLTLKSAVGGQRWQAWAPSDNDGSVFGNPPDNRFRAKRRNESSFFLSWVQTEPRAKAPRGSERRWEAGPGGGMPKPVLRGERNSLARRPIPHAGPRSMRRTRPPRDESSVMRYDADAVGGSGTSHAVPRRLREEEAADAVRARRGTNPRDSRPSVRQEGEKKPTPQPPRPPFSPNAPNLLRTVRRQPPRDPTMTSETPPGQAVRVQPKSPRGGKHSSNAAAGQGRRDSRL